MSLQYLLLIFRLPTSLPSLQFPCLSERNGGAGMAFDASSLHILYHRSEKREITRNEERPFLPCAHSMADPIKRDRISSLHSTLRSAMKGPQKGNAAPFLSPTLLQDYRQLIQSMVTSRHESKTTVIFVLVQMNDISTISPIPQSLLISPSSEAHNHLFPHI